MYYEMKNKILTIILLLIAFLSLLGGIVFFANMYQSPIAIEETKLHLFTFDRYQSQKIICKDGQTILLDGAAIKRFDEKSFLADVSQGESIFVRVEREDLSNQDGSVTALAILSENQHYLRFEDLNAEYKTRQSEAIAILIVGLLISIIAILFSLAFFTKQKT